jgi:hypothetical protein
MAKPNLCISRVDNNSSHGWIVRVKREKDHIIRFFSDSKSGGKRLSQQAAREFRDRVFYRLEREGKRPRAKKLVLRQKRNKTGVIGVSRVQKKKPDGTVADYYAVTWHPKPGLARGTTISIARYGEELAFKRACAIRNRQLMKRFGRGIFRKIRAMKDGMAQAAISQPNLTIATPVTGDGNIGI